MALVKVIDFETGNFTQFDGGVQAFSAARYGAVTDPVKKGTYAGRFHVAVGECIGGDCNSSPPRGRCEGIITEPVLDADEGEELWFRWYGYFPPTGGIGQRHTFSQFLCFDNTARPGFTGGLAGLFTVERGATGGLLMKFQRNGDRWSNDNTPKDTWHKFELHVVYSSNAALGLYEVWFNGTKVVTHIDKSKPSDGGVYMKHGVYQNYTDDGTTNPATTYYMDGLRIATTRAEADADGADGPLLLGTAAATASATLTLRAQTATPFAASAGLSSATLTLTAAPPFAASAGLSSATLTLTAGPPPSVSVPRLVKLGGPAVDLAGA